MSKTFTAWRTENADKTSKCATALAGAVRQKDWNNILADKATAWGVPAPAVTTLANLTADADDALARSMSSEHA